MAPASPNLGRGAVLLRKDSDNIKEKQVFISFL